jgi:hypothetical protein
MRIESFWAKGYRSLRDVRLDNLGPFNVFYGPNGGGKSNFLEALASLFDLTRTAVQMADHVAGGVWPGGDAPTPSRLAADVAIKANVLKKEDLCVYEKTRTLILGARLTSAGGTSIELSSGPLTLPDLEIEVTVDWAIEAHPSLQLSVLRTNGDDLLPFMRTGAPSPALKHTSVKSRDHLKALLVDVLPSRAYTRVGADRYPRVEQRGAATGSRDLVALHLQEGRLKSALLAAQIGPSAHVRRRLEALRSLLAGEPLRRPPFDPIQDPATGTIDLRERLPEPNPEGLEIPIDLAGLGISQIYAILAKAMLTGTSAVGIEEPEAHLHAPTSGRALRTLLVRLVEEKFVDQLFIATHSNLFDLDPTGYFDVSLKDGCTVVVRSDLTRIDREHLYEPGPAKHALEKLLQYAPEDEIVFRKSDGTGVTAKEMMRLLQEDDALAVRFLEDVHGAAVRMVKIQSKKSA